MIEQDELTQLTDYSSLALSQLTVPELSRRYKEKRLQHTGRKAEFVQRLSIAMGGQKLALLPATAPVPLVDVAPQVVAVNPLLVPIVADEVPQWDGNQAKV